MIIILSTIKSIYNLVTLKLIFTKEYNNKIVRMDDGLEFKIFRHMHIKSNDQNKIGSILIVRFKFKKYGHNINIKLSRIPILMIAGFPGFRDKIWMIDWEKGYWQGIYQWKDVDAIEKYKKSFVLGIMNKRSIRDTILYNIVPDMSIDDYIKSRIS